MSKVQIYPQSGKNDLQFHEILTEIKKFCLSDIAVNKVEKISPLARIDIIKQYLQQTKECMWALELKHAPAIMEITDVLPFIEKLKIKNYILPTHQLLAIIKLLRYRITLSPFLKSDEWCNEFPALSELLEGPFPPPELLRLIDSIFDDKGNVKKDASPELVRISNQINAKQREIDRTFKTIVSKYRKKNILTDTEESIRNGRRVISITADKKRSVNGILHDESSSGKTVFIEPQEIIPLNNELFNLFHARDREIKRLHQIVTENIAKIADEIPLYQNIMSWYEVIYAKAKYASDIDASMPKVLNEPFVNIKEGRHPILYLKNKAEDNETVPFSLKLDNWKSILVVSGPNAGGKSVLLKSVGLMQLMVQSGIPVPADSTSEFGIFTEFFTDIGDHQSVEDDLSTYSSHLTLMNRAIRKAGKSSMILYDEMGSGTDPQMGGSIAEAIMERLIQKHVYGVITTHYGNLKTFAADRDELLNGALLFDEKELVPVFKLKIGQPGSSFAFEIANNIGLPKDVIKKAKNLAGSDMSKVDELLVQLQRDKKSVEKKEKELSKQQKQVDNLQKTYNHLQAELEVRRKRMKMESRENALRYFSTQKRELDALIKELREQENLEKAKKLKEELKEKQAKTSREIREYEDEIIKADSPDGEIEVGNYVKLRKGDGTVGEVETIQNKKVRVIFGNMRMEVRLKDLVQAGEPITAEDTKTELQIENKDRDVKSKIDIRGLGKNQASEMLEQFIDKALIADLPTVEIVHGKGTGVLRKLTQEILQQYKDVRETTHPPAKEGGVGLTIVKFE